MKFCPNCGTKLKETNFGRLFCPNCGIVGDELPEDEEGERSYVG